MKYRQTHHGHVLARAFTLLEVIVAMTIFGAGVLGVMAALSMGSRTSVSAYRLAEASRLAESKMVLAVQSPAGSLLPERGDAEPYTWESSFESGPNGLTQANVTVTWTDRGQTDQYVLRQLFLPRQVGAE